jgi:dihydropyrimidinase
LVVEGGQVVTPEGVVAAEVVVAGEQVAGLVAPGRAGELAGPGTTRLDARGMLVLPGGVDVHTHLDMPLGELRSADSFASGTEAAVVGGTTTVVDFCVQPRGQSPLVGLAEWQERAEGRAVCDYGFHAILSDPSEAALADLPALVAEGVSSVKVFTAYPGRLYTDDGRILRTMQQAAASGMVCMVHAENGLAIDVLVAQALARGDVGPAAHGTTRPSVLEGEATHRAICLAEVARCPLYVVHLSAAEALAAVRRARRRGQPVFAETCPQYLFLDEGLLGGPGGERFVCSPPLRSEQHQEALWRGLARGDLQTVATDHCPFCLAERAPWVGVDFSKIPNGLPGIEHRLDLLHQGVVEGRLTLERMVELAASTPARLFGLWPKKGSLLPGADADLVVYDPRARQELSASRHHMAVDYSAYEGMVVTGVVRSVVQRGEVVVHDGRFLGRPGRGRYLPRPAGVLGWPTEALADEEAGAEGVELEEA